MPYSAAITEAYASQPDDELAIDTLEFHNSNFVDDDGNRTAARVAQGCDDWSCKLESTAPLNANEYVLFRGVPFSFTQPSFAENEVPSCTFSISNVSRELTKYMEQAIAKTEPIIMYYRPYLASDLTAPQMDPVYVMTLTAAKVGVTQITGTATLSDVHNWPFPYQKYTGTRFPGLVRP